MLTAKEAFERWKRNSNATPAEIREITDAGIVLADEGIDVVVGGAWPTEIEGAVCALCQECRREVTLSPDSGLAAVQRFPQVRILCLECTVRLAKKGVKKV
jgi:hypothetical protein